jgi:cation-transporting ATPase E
MLSESVFPGPLAGIAMNDTPAPGLTAAEVAERSRRGQVNRTPRADGAEYRAIVARNVFTLFNAIVVPAAIALFLLDEYRGAIAVSGFATLNTVLGLAQEIRAKRHLDHLAILTETRARVRREGQVHQVPASAIVQGDHVLLAAGDTVVADGPVLAARFLEVDEALLTGESDPVRRTPGQEVLSGSFAVAGEGTYRADKVGPAAFAQHTAAEARRYRRTPSPLQQSIDRLIRILTGTALALCGLYVVLYLVRGFPLKDLVQMIAATITAMVPQGLVLMATLAFLLGAVRMSRRGAVVQQLNAVESMAAVDVVCTDKTGTLTSNRLQLDRLHVLAADLAEADVRARLRLFAWASIDQQNKSIQALRAALGVAPADVKVLDQLPFKSQNRFSAVHLRHGAEERVLVMGACEALRDHLVVPAADWETAWHALLPTGLRLLLFAETDRPAPLSGSLAGSALQPLALVSLSDELRPEAGRVLEALAVQGIAFKVLSGDNPDTVRATVGRLRLPLAHEAVVAGDELARAADRAAFAAGHGVFGRVSPRQKVEIVQALKERGHHVAMIGDGVNDVLVLKQAHLGIAMGEGSAASKRVSGLVLETNDFALLPETLEEGRTIVRNLRRCGKLFLLKNVYSLLLIVGALGVFGLPFPYLPQQVTLLNLLTIGIPAFLLTLNRDRATAAIKVSYVREVGGFALRTGLVIGGAGLLVYLWAASCWPGTEYVKLQRTLLLSTLIVLGVTALLRVLTDGEARPAAGDTKFRWLAAAALPVYLAAMYLPWPADFFQLEPLTVAQWGLVLAVAGPAFVLCKLSDRWRGFVSLQ